MVSLKFTACFLIFILLIHIFATVYHWYWIFNWFDIPMHFFGGFWTAMAAIALIFNFQFPISNEIFKCRKLSFFIVILSFVALIGVFWEFFEFFYDVFISKRGISGFLQLGAADTIKDLFFDLFGGLIFIIIFLQIRKFKMPKI